MLGAVHQLAGGHGTTSEGEHSVDGGWYSEASRRARGRRLMRESARRKVEKMCIGKADSWRVVSGVEGGKRGKGGGRTRNAPMRPMAERMVLNCR